MNKRLNQIPFVLFIITWLVYLVNANKRFSIENIGDPDRYFQSFRFFLEHDYYTILQNGSSYLYNAFIWVFYSFTNSVSQAFFIANVVATLLVITIGILILKKINNALHSKYAIIVMAIFLCNTLSINAFQYSNNDMFQSVFVLSIFYLLFVAYYKEKQHYYLYAIVGVLTALCTLIRPTALIVVCIVAAAITIIEFFKSKRIISIFKGLVVFVVPLIVLTTVFHYPSLKENRKLGFYNKNFEPSNNWVQRNYLGAKRMQSGELPIHKNSIFRETTFAYVNEYLAENGETSLPKSQGEFIKKDPLLTIELIAYNIGFIGLKGSRYYAFLLIIPFLYFIKKPFLQKEKLPIYLYGIATLLISTIILTLMEYRWIIVYDILLCAGLLIGLNYYDKTKYSKNLRLLVKISLVTISIFNLLLTFYIKSSY